MKQFTNWESEFEPLSRDQMKNLSGGKAGDIYPYIGPDGHCTWWAECAVHGTGQMEDGTTFEYCWDGPVSAFGACDNVC